MASDKDGVWVFVPRDQLDKLRVAEPLAVPTEVPKKVKAVDALIGLWKEETSSMHPAPSFTEWLTQPLLSSTYRLLKLGTSRDKRVEYCQLIDVLRKERNAGGKCCLSHSYCSRHIKTVMETRRSCARCSQHIRKGVDYCCYCNVMNLLEQKVAKL
jgi:hypothetical protein